MNLTAEQIAANKKTAMRFHEPFMGGELSVLDEILAPSWVNHPRNAHEAPGPEGFKGTVQFFRSIFDMTFAVEDVLADNDKVAVRSLCTGVGRGEFMGHSVAGKEIAFNALEIHRFENGHVAESWHVQDYYAMLAQLGAIPNAMGAEVQPYPGWK